VCVSTHSLKILLSPCAFEQEGEEEGEGVSEKGKSRRGGKVLELHENAVEFICVCEQEGEKEL